MENTIINDGQRPRIRKQAASPLMFESDDEDSLGEQESISCINKENANESSESVAEPSKDQKILKGFQTVLMGIPPPPAFTVPQFDSREILKLWKDNYKYRVVLSPNKAKHDLIKQFEEEAVNTKWPEVTGLAHWDIYYNRSIVSEEIETLSVRYKERYVGVETASCINALYTKSPTRTASARKRMRQQAWGHSPGRRLSHLARRRKAFSSANLCSVAGNSRDKKMIMVEIKKIGNRLAKKNSAKKIRPTPKKKVQTEASTFKRALFQSPDQLPNAKQAQTPNSQRVHRSKRNLFANSSSEKRVNENGKRERITTRKISPRKRVNRSLSFQESHEVSQEPPPPHSRTSSNRLPQTSLTLTGAHKQKMLWAATNALREEGMGMNHELFRPSMTVLFKTCQKLWLTKVGGEDKEGSTSENMLALTKKFSSFTIKQISADPTSEHMVKVCNDIMRMAETILNQDNEQKQSSSATSKQSCSLNIIKNSETSNANQSIIEDGLSSNLKSSNIQKELIIKLSPFKVTSTKKSKYSPKNKKNIVHKVNGTTGISENSIQLSTPKGKNKLSKNNNLSSPESSSSLFTRSRTPMAQMDSVCNFTDQDSPKLAQKGSDKSNSTDKNHQSSKLILTSTDNMSKIESCFNKKSYTSSNFTKNKINQFDCPLESKRGNSKKLLNLESESLETKLDELDDGFEKNKENRGIVSLESDSQKIVEVEKSVSSHRLLSSVENTPQPQNRTLQLYRLSNSGGEHVDPEDLQSVWKPPKLEAHWDQQIQSGEIFHSVSQSSPPQLIPHWEQPSSETSTPLPESIMTHWQQMSASSLNTSDKIMFDYEDTSYEIVFPSTNEDDTRASSICAPFEYPHLVDDSKSGFNSVFVMGSFSGNSNSN